MCGIVGYIGKREAAPILLEGLKRLEYRGYDGAGIATTSQVDCSSILTIVKAVPKVADLEKKLETEDAHGHCGIGHTRWATHGEPNERNTHPHKAHTVAVVHNGIIENHEELRKELLEKGCCFTSDTDTEVLPHLIEEALSQTGCLLEDAVAQALKQVYGAYAIAVLYKYADKSHRRKLVAACNSSPLVIGVGKDGLYLASDEAALAGFATEGVKHLEDGQIAVLEETWDEQHPFQFRILGLSSSVELEPMRFSQEAVTKGGHAHFMHKEIFEQPQAMQNVLAGRLREGSPVIFGGFTSDIESRLKDARRIMLVGCGTSLFASMCAQNVIERMTGTMCTAEQAAEFAYREPVLSSQDVVGCVSQSGETADILKALALAKERHALCISVTNRVGSTLAKRTNVRIYLHAGPEIAVASTKAFTSQVAALLLFALRVAELKGADVSRLKAQMLLLPALLKNSIGEEEKIKVLAQKYKNAKRVIVIGRGACVPLAMEAALKIREVSYIDAHGLSAAELKHGTLALVEKGVPVFALMPNGKELRDKMLSNIEEVKTRGGEVTIFEAPESLEEELVPIILAPQLQLFAYHLGVLNGIDVDQPRNLAKSVTVE